MVIRQNNVGIGGLLAKSLLTVGLAACLLGGINPSPTAWAEESKETIRLDVDQDTQLVRVMRGNTPVRVMIASTGLPNTPTPNGEFQIQNRGVFFSVEKASAKYFTSFKGWGKYMFHSIIFDQKGKRIQAAAAERLGFKASHGCIRLPLLDAYWIYKNIPAGTKVVIRSKGAQTGPKTGPTSGTVSGPPKLPGQQLPAFSLEIDGKKVSFGKKPRWLDGILMVPARDLNRWVGGTVDWNEVEKLVIMKKDGNRVEFPVSIPKMTVNGQEEVIKIPAMLIYQTAWIPFEQAVSALGYQTNWEAEANRLVVKKPKYQLFINGRLNQLKLASWEENGQLLVPITAFSRALGAQVTQEVYQQGAPPSRSDAGREAVQTGQEVQQTGDFGQLLPRWLSLKVITSGGEVVFYPDSPFYRRNGLEYAARLSLKEISGQQFIGLQDLAEALALKAEFKPATGTVRVFN